MLAERQIVSRKAWGAAPPRKPRTRVNPAHLEGVVVHWFGRPRQARSHAGCDDLLRSVQRAHMQGEFIDIAYNMAVCPHGKIYRCRGFRFMSGANGNRDANARFGSVVYMAGEGDPPPSREAVEAIRKVIAYYRGLGAGPRVRRHGEITGSQCPGPYLSNLIRTEKFR